MSSGTKILWLLLAFCFLSASVLNSALPVSAQDSSDDPVAVLEQDAADKGLSLGKYLWEKLHGKYNSLGDLAAKSIEGFLNKGGTKTVKIDNKEMIITVYEGEEDREEYMAYFDIKLRNDDGTESGTLTLYMDNIRDYVNEKLYPDMEEDLNKTGNTPLKEDLAKLLKFLNIQPKAVVAGDRLVKELLEHPEKYTAITGLTKIQSDEPLATFEPDTDETGTPMPAEVLSGIINGSGDESNGVMSFADMLAVTDQIGLDVTDEMTDKAEELFEEPTGPGENGHQGGTWFLIDTVLPATGFASGAVAELREQPLSLAYGKTGMLLQIPELEVSEVILSVPDEAGMYSVEWLDRNVGMLAESSLPGSGVMVLTGHNHLNTMEAGPFLFIGTLENEDRIFITDREHELYTYKVYGNYKIPADGFASIAGDVHENTLILITCEDESADDGYLNRRVIFADPI